MRITNKNLVQVQSITCFENLTQDITLNIEREANTDTNRVCVSIVIVNREDAQIHQNTDHDQQRQLHKGHKLYPEYTLEQ